MPEFYWWQGNSKHVLELECLLHKIQDLGPIWDLSNVVKTACNQRKLSNGWTKRLVPWSFLQDYLKNGVDICCTNTLKSNSFAQKEYKTAKLVTEMNKAAALHLRRQKQNAVCTGFMVSPGHFLDLEILTTKKTHEASSPRVMIVWNRNLPKTMTIWLFFFRILSDMLLRSMSNKVLFRC